MEYLLICLQAVFQLSGHVCKSTWSCFRFMIDFLYITNFFSTVTTDDRHTLQSRSMLHFCMAIRFSYIVTLCNQGRRKRLIPSAHVHLLTCDPLPVIQQSKKIMESSEDVFNCIDYSKARRNFSKAT